MADYLSPVSFPDMLRRHLVSNGDVPDSVVALVLEEAQRYLAGKAWGYATTCPVTIADTPVVRTLAPGASVDIPFPIRPYCRDVEVWFLADADDGDHVALTFTVDQATANAIFVGRNVDDLHNFGRDRLGWRNVLVEGAPGVTDLGKSEAQALIGSGTLTIENAASSDGDVYLYAVSVDALHSTRISQ